MRYGWAWWGSPVGGRREGAGAGGEGQTYHPGALYFPCHLFWKWSWWVLMIIGLLIDIYVIGIGTAEHPGGAEQPCGWGERGKPEAEEWKPSSGTVYRKFDDGIKGEQPPLKIWKNECLLVLVSFSLAGSVDIIFWRTTWCFLSVQVFQGTDERPSKWHWLFKISQNCPAVLNYLTNKLDYVFIYLIIIITATNNHDLWEIKL